MMIGAGNEILYIGKAISLRNRVRSYFQEGAVHHIRIAAMAERVVDVRTIVVTNEVEALILEANLIKRHQPPFNVRLRDDKRYPYLKVTNEPFPRVVFTRMVRRRRRALLRPLYQRSRPARADRPGTARLSAAHVPRTDRRTAQTPVPAVSYHRCLAPCVGYQSEEEYDATIDEVVLFLEGKQDSLLRAAAARDDRVCRTLQLRGGGAASRPHRPGAARHRGAEGRVEVAPRHGSDRASRARRDRRCMQVFLVRGGKLIGQEHFILDGVYEQSDDVLMDEFLKQFYTARTASAAEENALSLVARSRATIKLRCRRGARVACHAGGSRAEGAARRRATRRTRDHRSVALDDQGTARANLAPAARRARRVHAPGSEECRAESQSVLGASGSAGDGAGDGADRSRRRARAVRSRRIASSATTSRTSRGPIPSRRWSSSSKAARRRASTASSRSSTTAGRTISR